MAALILGSASLASADVLITNVFNTFDTAASGTGVEWGPGTVAWDGTTGNPAGSLLMTLSFGSGSDTPAVAYICLAGGNPWYQPQTVNCSLYKFIEFDVKYDPTSDVTLAQFNDLSTWDTTTTNQAGQLIMQGWAGSGYLSGSTPGFDIELCGGPAGQMGPQIITTNIPAAAATGWAHMKIPINQAQAQIDGVNGIVFHKWINQQWGIANTATVRLWIDNVMLTGTAAPPPPPIVSVPTKATPGLHVFTSTAGSPYDRQSAVLRQTSGLSWVGMAAPANPVTYSFTIAGYPNSVNCEAWLFLIPNPTYLDGAPDWNETNAIKIRLQGSPTRGLMQFQYKVNENNQQAMYTGGSETRTAGNLTNNYYYTALPLSLPGGPVTNMVSPGVYNITNESGALGSVTNNSIFGMWTVRFTSDTDVTLIAPNGNSSSFVLPSYNAALFAEQTSPAFYAYLGMQANNADAYNQAIVYSNFAISNTASPFSEDFTADPVLDTTNVWNTSAASGPKGVLIAPAGSAYWVKWTLPDTGFSLQTAPHLGDPLGWSVPSAGPQVPLNGFRAQLLATNDIPAGNTAFFELIDRVATQLQVLLPGETNAPNTLTGKGGTPTVFNAGDSVNVTINAVDSTFHIVNSGDSLALTSTDSGPIFYFSTFTPTLVNGTVTVLGNFDSGSWTVTATDSSSTNLTAGTSSAVTIQ